MDHGIPQDGIVRLDELPIHVWLSDQSEKITRITESPYYVSLIDDDPAIFYAYHDAMRGLPSVSSEISWDQFLDLRDDIASNGLRDTQTPIRFGDRGQLDGHHRLAILCHLYGPQTEVFISGGVAVFPVPVIAFLLYPRAWIGHSARRLRFRDRSIATPGSRDRALRSPYGLEATGERRAARP
jgi:hypothetical protein